MNALEREYQKMLNRKDKAYAAYRKAYSENDLIKAADYSEAGAAYYDAADQLQKAIKAFKTGNTILNK